MKKTSCDLYNTDDLMKKIWVNLVRDFRVSLDDPSFLVRQEQALNQGVSAFRREPFPAKMQAPVYRFKCLYQMENLFKRYIFQNDLYDSKGLDEKCAEEFIKFQERISKPLPVTELTFRVMQEARKINKRILGRYDQEEHYSLCRFGKRAANGVPFSEAYLDVKVEVLTGSKDHVVWFKNYLATDDLLNKAILDVHLSEPQYWTIDALNLAPVPKSFKTKRTIEPNSVLGGFFSYGLGRVVEKRLKTNAKLDIRRLQQKHRRIVKSASVKRHLVTGDLSKASDGPDSPLMNRLLPREWFNIFKLGRINQVKINRKRYYMHSFMAMGIGFTFTLETLIFYSLLQAISNLTGIRGKISVYGDDLIYPTALHRYVEPIFKALGIIMNADKTFVKTHFRESCGSDFYHGVDVRPFQPEMEGGPLGRRQYVVYCYKLLNGLLMRWDRAEIPLTVYYLLREIAAVDGQVFQVPLDFPDTAGFKVRQPNTEWYIPWDPILWNRDLQCSSFRYYRECSGDRYVEFIAPYFWETMRAASTNDTAFNPFEDANDSNIVRWIRPKRENRRFYTGKYCRKRFCELVAAVNDKQRRKTLIQESTTSKWA